MSVLQIYGCMLQIYGFAPTDLWSYATKRWCYPQADDRTATDLWSWSRGLLGVLFRYECMVTDWIQTWCYKFMVDAVDAILLQIYGPEPPLGRFTKRVSTEPTRLIFLREFTS